MTPAISCVGATEVVPSLFKGELPFTYKPSSVVLKMLSTPSASFISTNGSAVSATKFAEVLILPPTPSEALLVEPLWILVAEISGALVVAVFP